MKGLAAAAKQPEMEMEDEMADLSEAEELDAQIAYGLAASALLEEQGIQGLNEAMNQQNPIPLVAGIVASLVKDIAEGTQGTEIELSPNVWLAEGGAVDRLLDLISEISGQELDDAAKGAIFSDVVDQIKLFSQAAGQKEQMPPNMGMGMPDQGTPGMPPSPQMMGMPA
jgi:hypothetical protein